MTDPVAYWHAEHANFARLLGLLDRELAAFHLAEQPNYDLMLDITRYLRHFPDRYHHPREDVAFDRLVSRDPTMTTSINRLKQEHRVLAAAGEDLLETLTEIVSGVLLPRAIVEAAAATYLVYFRHHLAYEEREILPVAAKLLTPEDWRAVSAAVPGAPDPLFGEDSDSGYRDLRRQIAEES